MSNNVGFTAWEDVAIGLVNIPKAVRERIEAQAKAAGEDLADKMLCVLKKRSDRTLGYLVYTIMMYAYQTNSAPMIFPPNLEKLLDESL